MNVDLIKEKILRYEHRTQFMANCKREYAWLRQNGLIHILDELRPRRNAIKDVITIEYVLERARKCDSYSNFQTRYYRLYRWAKDFGHLYEVEKILPPVPHMERAALSADVRRCSDNEIFEHALKFGTRREWRSACITSKLPFYGAAVKRGRAFMQKCCSHMPDERGGSRGFTLLDADIRASARTCQARNEWRHKDYGAYQAAKRRKIYEECCAHMRPASNPFAADYIVYAYEFSDRHCYVGLTFMPENRKMAHACRGPVFEHAKVCPNPIYRVLLENATCDAAIAGESVHQATYLSEGWIALHTAKAGSLGSIKSKSRWTKEAVLAQALLYKSKQAWIDGSQMSYRIAKREGWFEEASAHMPKRVLGIGAGVPKTAEAREKMRQAKLGGALSASHKAKIAASVGASWQGRN